MWVSIMVSIYERNSTYSEACHEVYALIQCHIIIESYVKISINSVAVELALILKALPVSIEKQSLKVLKVTELVLQLQSNRN